MPKNGLYQEYSRFKNMKQETKSIKEYAEAFQEAISRINIGMNEAIMTMTFINSLSKRICKKVLLMINCTVRESIENAKMAESSIKINEDKTVSIVESNIQEAHLVNLNSQINDFSN